MKEKKHFANGFTLAEIIISTLLLSIFAVGTFKSTHYAQNAANITLKQYLRINQQKQSLIIRKLAEIYPAIHIDADFPLLKCLVEHAVDPGSELKADCSQV